MPRFKTARNLSMFGCLSVLSICGRIDVKMLLCCAIAFFSFSVQARAPHEIHLDLKKPVAYFDPRFAFGAGIDGHELGDNAKIFTPHNLAVMKQMGLRSLTYRLRTELATEAWHWNPQGTWSEPSSKSGYWTSSVDSKTPIKVSFGYRLPRRGSSGDQASDDSYSRIDDGDENSYWKSNPYLTTKFTHESESAHTQWVVADLDKLRPVDTIKLHWAAPYATHYRISIWQGVQKPNSREGHWILLPRGDRSARHGGEEIFKIPGGPVEARFIKFDLLSSSGTAMPGSHDPRDFCGFAVRELFIGRTTNKGFVDVLRHGKHAGQSTITVSSVDPWHRSTDLDKRVEQPGLDLIAHSGLGSGLPILFPAPVLYSEPGEGARLVEYLKRHHISIRAIEMGEEPDGQAAEARDYAALYRQVGGQILKVYPGLPLGAPCFQTVQEEFELFPNEESQKPFMYRFKKELSDHHALDMFNFLSFEWYPFDSVKTPSTYALRRNEELLQTTVNRFDEEVGHKIPWMITEYGFSAFAGEPEMTRTGALFNAETAALSLIMGIDTTYLYGYEPTTLLDETRVGSYGQNGVLLADEEGQWKYKTATYWSSYLISHDWCASSGKHAIYPEIAIGKDLRAYVIKRPSGEISVLLVNRSTKPQSAVLPDLKGTIDVSTFGPNEYKWLSKRDKGHPLISRPPTHAQAASGTAVALPPLSLVVVRGT